jgi:hypothetical protein
MSKLARISVVASWLLYAAVPSAGAVESASGTVALTLDDRVTRDFSFRAVNRDDGTTVGDLTFTDPAATPGLDPDDPGKEPVRGLSVAVQIDCLVVGKNQALLSGVVVKASFPDAVGQRALLRVEDGDGLRIPDGITWGLYGNPKRTWTPADAELKDDRGWSLTWTATDAERRDDPGVKIVRDPVIGCDSFPLVSYVLFDVEPGRGEIDVTP